ncbi:hypothetical protein [Paenibacillus pabuli]|uniref:hypothetical protein n=1 Tax=Paenibacillus pabuli TaxID=1472 RepID=UPI0007827D52|nr:hypothetical protein [Paenibacillus pabuli]
MGIIEKESLLYKKTSRTLGYMDFMNGRVTLNVSPNIHKNTIKGMRRVTAPENKVKILQHELNNNTHYSEDKIRYLQEMTTYFHELKHWHEYVGTSLGYEIYKIYLEYYSRTIMILRYMGNNSKQIKLPLNSLNFYNKATKQHYTEYNDFLNRFGKLKNRKVFIVDNIFEDVRKLKSKNFNKRILKDIPFFLDGLNIEEIIFADVPLTGISLLEASAVLTQVFAIYDIYGLEESNLFLKQAFESPILWAYNSVIKSMLCAHPNVPNEMMQAIITHSITYPLVKQQTAENDPIERFMIFLEELKKTDETPRSLPEIEQWILNIYRKLNWTEPKDFLTEQVIESEKILKQHQLELEKTDNFTDAIEDYNASYHSDRLYFLHKLRENIIYWSKDYYYEDTPKPHAVNLTTSFKKPLQFTNNELNSSLRWYFSTNIIEQLFSKSKEEFICPFKGKNECPAETESCGKFPLQMPPDHPECEFLVTSCEIVLPNWDIL